MPPEVLILRLVDNNDRLREGRNGRDYVSTAPRVIWVAYANGEYVGEYTRKRDALAAHPGARIVVEG